MFPLLSSPGAHPPGAVIQYDDEWVPLDSTALPQLDEPLRNRVGARHVGLHPLVQQSLYGRGQGVTEPLGLERADVRSGEAG
jgi:hypothetical protein